MAVQAAPLAQANQRRYAPIIGVEHVDHPECIVEPTWDGRQWKRLDQVTSELIPWKHLGQTTSESVSMFAGPKGHGHYRISTVTAPDGRWVPVTTSMAWEWHGPTRDYVGEWAVVCDGRDEVATEMFPASTVPANSNSPRVATIFARCVVRNPVTGTDHEEIKEIGTFDYSKYGYVKIGKIWVNPANATDVAKATQRMNGQGAPWCVLV
jgi:hypothetical protein